MNDSMSNERQLENLELQVRVDLELVQLHVDFKLASLCMLGYNGTHDFIAVGL